MSNKITSAFSKVKSVSSKSVNAFGEMPKGKKVYAYLWMLSAGLLATSIGLFVGTRTQQSDYETGKWSVKADMDYGSSLDYKDDNSNNTFDKGEKITVDGNNVVSFIKFDGSTWQQTQASALANNDDFLNWKNQTTAYTPVQDNVLIDVKADAKDVSPELQALKGTNLGKKDGALNVQSAKGIYDIKNPVTELGSGEKITTTDATVDKTKISLDQNLVFAVATNKDDATKQVVAPLTPFKKYSFDTWKNGALKLDSVLKHNATAAIAALFAVSLTVSILTTASVEMMKKRKAKNAVKGASK